MKLIKMDPNVGDEGVNWLFPSAQLQLSRTLLGCHSICVIKSYFHRQLEVYAHTGRGENKKRWPALGRVLLLGVFDRVWFLGGGWLTSNCKKRDRF